MKSYHKLSIVFLTLGMLFFSACEKQLEQSPNSSVSAIDALGNISGVRTALNGMYASMQSRNYYGRMFIAYADHSTDNGIIPSGAGSFVKIERFYQMTYGPTTSAITTWAQIYDVIARANNVINNVDDAEGGTADEKNRIKGEATFVRALAHHDLLRLFAHDYQFTDNASHDGVPYITITEIGEPSRNSVAECYQLILQDLDEAIRLVGANSRTGADAPSFASTLAAKALKARVYLYMGDWSNALTAANEVIDNGNHTLAPYIVGISISGVLQIDSWAEKTPNSEAIFELEFDELDGLWGGKSSVPGLYMPQPDGHGEAGPNMDIINLYTAEDVRRNWYREKGGIWFVNKYPTNAELYSFSLPVLRLTEMILIKAECHARLGEEQQARDAVNQIALRANAPEITSSGGQLLDDILEERRRELAFEAHRFFDLKRLQQDIDRQDCPLAENCFVPYGDRLYAYPIPQEEMDANPNMTQNPGY